MTIVMLSGLRVNQIKSYLIFYKISFYRLVEEFMLLANMAVAHKIYKSFPEDATLRRHPPPQSRMVDELVSLVFSGYGVKIVRKHLNPWSTELRNLNFQPLEVVNRGSKTQLQVTENLCYL